MRQALQPRHAQDGPLPELLHRSFSLITGVKYRASKTDTWTWYAGTPFPAVNTHTIDTELISRAGTDNFIAHTTINATGVPTVTVDTVRLECAG